MKAIIIAIALLTFGCGDDLSKEPVPDPGPYQSTCRHIQANQLEDEIKAACQTVSDERRLDAAKALRYTLTVEVGGDETNYTSTSDGWVLFVEDGWTQQTLVEWVEDEVDFRL
jgi:hypothetical protein